MICVNILIVQFPLIRNVSHLNIFGSLGGNIVADVDTREGGCTKLVKLENCREKDKEKENGRFREEDQESDWERDKYRHHREKDLLNINASPNKEEFTNKPISEVNLSNSEYCTPSYLLSD